MKKGIFIILLVLCISFTFVHILLKLKQCTFLVKNQQDKISSLIFDIDNFKAKRIHEFESEDLIMDKFKKVVSLSDDTIYLKDLISSDKLLFKYSINNCSQCVDTEINNLIRFRNKIGKERIILLAYYNNLRELASFSRKFKNELNIYLLPDNNYDIKADSYEIPYYCILNKDFQAQLVFFPEKKDTVTTNKYFNLLVQRFFNIK